ncbi:MAG: dTDP-glucose 4,6-dehydratase [Pseudodesulfovibrio sp.]|uniref:dTDP-glucose 4,6-dehydratase n=1 Tax=Pseudodesulfovibrio aespoeensis (strain ATCC 700646 / DSM 10631 / Aspo-2) TaxID=643562 RepID=E6VUU1_PSEA9|nr:MULTISPECIES: dTDP-glucose 4,6-dehydratase [Pseudodesulfovibrio]MBU4191647.1 dTDP-glucose 4,6-dehydratase [Pseudomonadota bacterium]ADU62332.1 dTDP-glucose 4,6-dehydratase [Pseudodesulfovibrio aespoeensis Aspo-2]MBU4243734.1 dTDP-glucose 4,6-dehydratase [Pseudomonadota bacterium]MBU4379924.1 dTDP-glucose 4,6-dehydratase [Pseudomonadota bacterium]MBU4474003.1 dTDP-glucose 4,6-dehydratase [Pseudomonadota bacterium]
MKLLVTGGCGFIGTNFIRLMLGSHPDWSIVNLDKLTYAGNRLNLADLERDEPRYRFVRGDICDRDLVMDLLAGNSVDAVVNFAAESHVDRSISDPAPFVTTNVQGAQNLFECARQRRVGRFVHISTDEVYGTLGPQGQFTESTPLAPNSPYSASKAGADLMARAYFETYGFPALITRCSNNYGPYQFPEKLIPLMYLTAMADKPLPVYGDGQNVRDWIYVDDHCRGVELTLLKGRDGCAYNFGGNAEETNLNVVKTLLSILGKPESLITFVGDRPGHDRRYAMDYSLAAAELGFAPTLDFATGLRRTIDWYQANGEWLAQVQSGEYRRFMDSWYEARH